MALNGRGWRGSMMEANGTYEHGVISCHIIVVSRRQDTAAGTESFFKDSTAVLAAASKTTLTHPGRNLS
jgi:hypothetical protein